MDLIQALIQIKTPLTLFAFLIFLAAFRTKRVPELFFDLIKSGLPKQRLLQLLNRFMAYAFAAFVVVCGVAVVGQVLAYKTEVQPVPANDLRVELNTSNAPQEQKDAALTAYTDGLAQAELHNIAQAIEDVQTSINAIPTLSAQITLAYLYQRSGDQGNARKYTAAAESLAVQRGDALAQVRLHRLRDSSSEAGESLIGVKEPFPAGGKAYEDAVAISPGLYILTRDLDDNDYVYYKMRLKSGQTLVIDCRSPESGGAVSASIYDKDGVRQQTGGIGAGSQRVTVQWTTPVDGLLYFGLGATNGVGANGVYRISIR